MHDVHMYPVRGESGRRMKKFMGRLFIFLLFLVLLAGGGLWWFSSYIAPDQERDLAYGTIDVREKALDMIKAMKPELVLSETDINNLIKKNMDPDISEKVTVDGADFTLEGSLLLADLNITYYGRIPAEVQAAYDMEWDGTKITLQPVSLRLKDISLPVSMLETITVPLDLPVDDMVKVEEVRFEAGQVKVLFRIQLPF